MNGVALLNALREAGHAVDQVAKTAHWVCYACRVNRAEVRRILSNQNWHPTGMDHFADGGVFRFYVWKRPA